MPRALDFTLALVGTILLAPLFAVVAIFVRLRMGSPVLFIQCRAGRAGQPFKLIKLRSMNDVTDDQNQPLPDVERTPMLGRFLRRSRLDELPELLNIIRGDMAFVGPRPLLPKTVDDLGKMGHRRGSVRPGLTGWAQVNGNAMLTLQQKVALDLWYIDHRSLWLDLKILVRTVGVVVLGERINSSRVEDAVEGCHRRGC